MRKLKKTDMDLSINPAIKDNELNLTEKESKEIKFILLISWIFPFFGTFFLYLVRKKLLEKPKSILCKINNMNFTVILVNFILVSIMQTLAFAKVPAYIIFTMMAVITGIFLLGFISHIIATFKWLRGEEFSYRFIGEFFKPYENI